MLNEIESETLAFQCKGENKGSCNEDDRKSPATMGDDTTIVLAST